MTKSFEKLLDVAIDLKVFFEVPSYTLFHYEDGSYVEFVVRKVKNLPKVLELCQGLEINFFGHELDILVRVEENPFSLDENNE